MLAGAVNARFCLFSDSHAREGEQWVYAWFFELFDEVSDIVLAGLFYADTNNKRWAGHVMFVFMGLNRFVQFVASLALGQSFLSAIEGLIGVKCITDTR